MRRMVLWGTAWGGIGCCGVVGRGALRGGVAGCCTPWCGLVGYCVGQREWGALWLDGARWWRGRVGRMFCGVVYFGAVVGISGGVWALWRGAAWDRWALSSFEWAVVPEGQGAEGGHMWRHKQGP